MKEFRCLKCGEQERPITNDEVCKYEFYKPVMKLIVAFVILSGLGMIALILLGSWLSILCLLSMMFWIFFYNIANFAELEREAIMEWNQKLRQANFCVQCGTPM